MAKFKISWNEDTVENWEAIIEAESIAEVQAKIDDGSYLEGADVKDSFTQEGPYAHKIFEITELYSVYKFFENPNRQSELIFKDLSISEAKEMCSGCESKGTCEDGSKWFMGFTKQ